jgi:hypothetical protein
MTSKENLATLPAPAFIALGLSPAEAFKIAEANLYLARKAEDLATMAVWEADLGKDADAARVIYRKMAQTRREVESILEALAKAK